jgi:hypothetical protein
MTQNSSYSITPELIAKVKEENKKKWLDANYNQCMLIFGKLSPDLGYYLTVDSLDISLDIFPDEYRAIKTAFGSVLEKLREYRKKMHDENPQLKKDEMKRFIDVLNSIGRPPEEKKPEPAKWICIAKEDIPSMGITKGTEGNILDFFPKEKKFRIEFPDSIRTLEEKELMELFIIED